MKPYEMLAAILRGVGIVSIINSPPAMLTLTLGPILIAAYQFFFGIVLLVCADSIARWCYRRSQLEATEPAATQF